MLQKLFRLTAIVPFMAMLIASPSAEAGRTQPIYTPDPIEVPPGKSHEEVRKAIRKALFAKDWAVKEIAPGQIEGKHTKQGKDVMHVAVITIRYDTKAVHIAYKDSKELNYDAKSATIHHTYNGWVRNVEKYIRSYLDSY